MLEEEFKLEYISKCENERWFARRVENKAERSFPDFVTLKSGRQPVFIETKIGKGKRSISLRHFKPGQAAWMSRYADACLSGVLLLLQDVVVAFIPPPFILNGSIVELHGMSYDNLIERSIYTRGLNHFSMDDLYEQIIRNRRCNYG